MSNMKNKNLEKEVEEEFDETPPPPARVPPRQINVFNSTLTKLLDWNIRQGGEDHKKYKSKGF